MNLEGVEKKCSVIFITTNRQENTDQTLTCQRQTLNVPENTAQTAQPLTGFERESSNAPQKEDTGLVIHSAYQEELAARRKVQKDEQNKENA